MMLQKRVRLRTEVDDDNGDVPDGGRERVGQSKRKRRRTK